MLDLKVKIPASIFVIKYLYFFFKKAMIIYVEKLDPYPTVYRKSNFGWKTKFYKCQKGYIFMMFE